MFFFVFHAKFLYRILFLVTIQIRGGMEKTIQDLKSYSQKCLCYTMEMTNG